MAKKPPDFDWNRARALLVAAREGSYSGAARVLGVAQPTIGRQIAQLEEELGVALFEHVGRGLQLTPTGTELVEHIGRMSDAAAQVAMTAAGQATSLEGLVTVTASEVISAHLLPPILSGIRATHPRIMLDLVASNERQDLRRREADIAVRNGRPEDPELFAKKLPDARARFYGSHEYLAQLGRKRGLDSIARAQIFGFDRSDMMISGLAKLGLHLGPENFQIVTGNHLVQWELCKRGLGLCIILEEVGDAEPAVARASDAIPPFPVPMWLTAHRELLTSRRIRAVFDLLAEGLAEPRPVGQDVARPRKKPGTRAAR